ncbi:MAG: hypothetical protein NVS3B10_29070 [Polyangiales bacterium]
MTAVTVAPLIANGASTIAIESNDDPVDPDVEPVGESAAPPPPLQALSAVSDSTTESFVVEERFTVVVSAGGA